jgi:putrescine---pyruvate transaminase
VLDATLQLAERVASFAPLPDAKVFFTSGGSEAIDTAAKLVRRYWDVVGRPEKQIIVAREFSYHGMAAYGTSLAGIATNREGYGGSLVPTTRFVPPFDLDAIADLFAREGEQIAAFIGEPVIGAGGVYAPPDGFWPAVADLCRQYDILLIADEVITGFGRTGRMFGVERYGYAPDLLVFAKGITSGYQPLGGVIVGPRVQEPFWERGGNPFRHGYTYTGHGGAMAAGMANLDIFEREGLVARVATMEPTFDRIMRTLEDAPRVTAVRTVGSACAVDVDVPPPVLEQVVAAGWKHGVLTRTLRGKALHISPTFVITEAELEGIASGLRAALTDVAATL